MILEGLSGLQVDTTEPEAEPIVNLTVGHGCNAVLLEFEVSTSFKSENTVISADSPLLHTNFYDKRRKRHFPGYSQYLGRAPP